MCFQLLQFAIYSYEVFLSFTSKYVYYCLINVIQNTKIILSCQSKLRTKLFVIVLKKGTFDFRKVHSVLYEYPSQL